MGNTEQKQLQLVIKNVITFFFNLCLPMNMVKQKQLILMTKDLIIFFFLVHYLIQEKHRSPHFPPVELEEIIKQFASNKKTISITNINIYKSKTLTEMNFKKLLQPTRTSNCF